MMFLGDRGTHDWASTCSPSTICTVPHSVLPYCTTRRAGHRIVNQSYGAAVAEAALGRIRM